MRKMFMYLCLFAIVSVLNAYGEEIKVAYFDFPPLVISGTDKDQKPTGSMVNYYEKMAKHLGMSVKWIGPMPAPRAIYFAKKNEVDAVIFLTKNPDREKIVLYPEKPVYIMTPVVCLRKESKLNKVDSWSDLISDKDIKKIGTIYGTSFEKKLSKKHPQLNLVKLRMKGEMIERAMELMKNVKLDAFLWSDKNMVDVALDKLKLNNSIKVLSAPVPERPLYNVFSLKRSDLLEKYNLLFDKLRFGEE